MIEPTPARVCQLCGGPVSKRNTSGFCHQTPECKRKSLAAASKRYRQAHPEEMAAHWTAYSPGYKQRRAELDAARREDSEFVEKARQAVRAYKTNPANADRVRGYNRRGRLKYMARTDRKCLSKGCDQHPRAGFLWCDPHQREESRQSHHRRVMRLRARLAERQEMICPWCRLELPPSLARTHVDHIIPRAVLVIEEEWNYQLLHARCNQEKSDKITPQAVALAAEHGLLLPVRERIAVLQASLLTFDGKEPR